MSEYTEAISKAVTILETAEAAHAVAAQRLSTVRGLNGQRGYSVTVNGVTVDVAICDSRTYQGTLVRGREMIHLGALKALGAQVQTCVDNVKAARRALIEIISATSSK